MAIDSPKYTAPEAAITPVVPLPASECMPNSSLWQMLGKQVDRTVQKGSPHKLRLTNVLQVTVIDQAGLTNPDNLPAGKCTDVPTPFAIAVLENALNNPDTNPGLVAAMQQINERPRDRALQQTRALGTVASALGNIDQDPLHGV